MNERVKAILSAAVRLSTDERRELAQAVLDTLELDPDAVSQMLSEDEPSGDAEETRLQPTSDVLAKYLDT